MDTPNPGHAILAWFGQVNYEAMQWTNGYWWPVWAGLVFAGCLIGMAPLSTHHEHPFYQIVFVWIRKGILWSGALLIVLPLIMLYVYEMTTQNQISNSQQVWFNWFIELAKHSWFTVVAAAASGIVLRFTFKRYALPALSGLLRRLRNTQTKETPTDIRKEASRFKAKDFLPSKHYKKDAILVGLNEDNKPIHIPTDTWYETNVQVIGPTRYGKGVIMGGIMDQAIRRGDCLFYIDPKKDKFAPHVMYQACKAAGRKFYYLTLHDDGIGKWAPFAGGSPRDGLARLETAFGLELTGDPGTDYYKSQERKELEKAFKQTRNIEGLKKLMEVTDANRINAELARWSYIESLCPKKGSGFSIEKALKEGAVVYVQGSLDDSVVKTATKVFITEIIQEARRLEKERKTHLITVIDEVSFLASKTLAQALATAVGFRVNFVLAYQSQNDLLNLDDKTVNPKYVHQSINVNSQIKAVYGGADFDTAEWAANLSGTIVKEVTKMEKTDISGTGGETWDNERTVGTQEENHITTNMVLSLPPRVCVFVQPRHLATICFSSFVPVSDMKALEEYLDHKIKTYSSPVQVSEEPDGELNANTAIDSVPEEICKPSDVIENKISQAKSVVGKGDANPKDDNKQPGKVLPFKGSKDNKKAIDKEPNDTAGVPARSENSGIENIAFFEDQAPKQESDPIADTTTGKGSDEKNPSPVKPVKTDGPGGDGNLDSDDAAKKREKNRARKAKQKAKKQSNTGETETGLTTQTTEPAPAKPDSEATTSDEPGTTDPVPQRVELIEDFTLEFAALNLQSDETTMSLLTDLDEDEEK